MAFTSQRVDFQLIEFQRAIEQKGYWMTWEKASMCPCITKDKDGQPNFNCPLCRGKGKYWREPEDIQGVMTNFNEQDKFTQVGEIVSGTSYFTTMPVHKLGFWDRLTNWHSTIRFSEIIEKGDRADKDKLRFAPIETVCGHSVRTVEKVYVEGVDFVVSEEEGTIDWSPGAGNEPTRGERYSIEYFTHPRWIVIDLVNVIRDTYVKRKQPGVTFTEMPVRAVIRLEWFVL